MNANTIIIILSLIVVVSYLFDMLARTVKFPSVLMLLFLGIALQYVTEQMGIQTPKFANMLPVIGTIGLILIVLEGSLELHYNPQKQTMIRDAFLFALYGFAFTVLLTAAYFFFYSHASVKQCFANAIPFGVISSAIAIPSSVTLHKSDREFIIYESSFSDILGVMAMNFVVYNEQIKLLSFVQFGFDVVLILIITLISSLFILYLLGRIKHQVKFFLILAILFLVYGVGKTMHLAPLLLVLGFGLFLSNAHLIKNKFFRKVFMYDNFQHDIRQLSQLTAESAFLMRTIFFTIFGYAMPLAELSNKAIIIAGTAILAMIYVPRLLLLTGTFKRPLIPILFMAPRGLISLLLFLTLPETLKIEGVNQGLLVVIVLTTGIMMTIGLLSDSKKQTD